MPYWDVVGQFMRLGATVGATFAAMTLVALLLVGPAKFAARLGPPLEVVVLHVPGGFIAGAIVGLLHRRATSAVWSAVIGVVAFVPYFVLAGWAMFRAPPWLWTRLQWGAALVGAMLFGGGLGIQLWRDPAYRLDRFDESEDPSGGPS